ncbi:hypothetical protein [Actinomadura chibensis]|uniref:Uncharacterized protein n=1 Tax=Actinomadura chibensis TaxID=392828 RepID=A0A5D0P0H2_9ACTN|nr:hypothetical protein [Actinomadura chibensis]TYB49801.1 hypothetical protein FXF69_12325 [Actinomadura chibensis]
MNGAAGYGFHSTAKDQSNVANQGIVNGDVHLYVTDGATPPPEMLEKARNCLAAGMAQPARVWFKNLFTSGANRSNEVLYYWILAIVSQRTIADLNDEEYGDLNSAFAYVHHNPADTWSAAIGVIWEFIELRRRQETAEETDPADLEKAKENFGRLVVERQVEIQLHLNRIETGATQDAVEDVAAERVRVNRMRDARRDRVWKYFEPVPERPRPQMPQEPRLTSVQTFLAVIGLPVLALGFLLPLVTVFSQKPAFVLVLLVPIIAGGALLGYCGPRCVPSRYVPFDTRSVPDPAFRASIDGAVDRIFTETGWPAGRHRSVWTAHTRRIRSLLAAELAGLYTVPRIRPGGIDWLIRWHAQQTFQRWWTGDLRERRRSTADIVGAVLGAVAGGLGTLVLLGAAVLVMKAAVLLVFLMLPGGAALTAGSRLDVYLLRRHRLPAERDLAQRRWNAECQEYVRWTDSLSDRPTDVEMAKWLHYDEIHLMTMIRKQYRLANVDVIEYAVLTEPAPGARRARVRRGPWRYTAYIVWLYLLTEAGVRQVTVHLDFATGIASNQRRTTFRYDAIASAGIQEIGVGFADGRREVLPFDGRLLIGKSFTLALLNGENFHIDIESLSEARGEQDDVDWLMHLSLDGAVADSALRLLEEVAAEGGERVSQSRRRRGFPPFAEPDKGRDA